MTTKTFTHAGYSKLNGEYKARFANDALRVKVLEKGGHEDVQITEFVKPLTKTEAVQKLLEMNFAKGNTAAQAALEAELDKRTEQPKAAKAPKVAAKAKAPAKKGPSMDAIKAKASAKASAAEKAAMAKVEADLEDAPF